MSKQTTIIELKRQDWWSENLLADIQAQNMTADYECRVTTLMRADGLNELDAHRVAHEEFKDYMFKVFRQTYDPGKEPVYESERQKERREQLERDIKEFENSKTISKGQKSHHHNRKAAEGTEELRARLKAMESRGEDTSSLGLYIMYEEPEDGAVKNALDTVDWVAACLRKAQLARKNRSVAYLGAAPSEEALSMLTWACDTNQNQTNFWTSVWNKLKLSEKHLAAEAKRADDGRELIEMAKKLQLQYEKSNIEHIGEELFTA